MSEPIELTLEWDEETYLKGAKVAYDLQMKHTGRKYVGWIFIAMLQFGVVGALQANTYGMLMLSTLLLLYWYYLRWPLRKMALKRFFEKSPFANRTLHIAAEEGGLCIDDSCVPWHEFQRVIATRDGYLLDMVDRFLFIPKGHFRDVNEQEAFSALLRRTVKHFQQMEI